MTDKRNDKHTLSGITCSAASCQYNCENHGCTAQGIKVGNEAAIRSGETFCGTFIPSGTKK